MDKYQAMTFFLTQVVHFNNIVNSTAAAQQGNGGHVQTDDNRDVGNLSSLVRNSKVFHEMITVAQERYVCTTAQEQFFFRRV